MTDYKQLCAELVAAWDDLPWQYNWKGDLTGLDGYPPDDSAVERARAALAEPEPQRRCIYSPSQIAECGGPCEQGPEHCDCGELWITEPEGLADEELILTYAFAVAEAVNAMCAPLKPEDYKCAQLAGLRAVLARWGNHPGSPDSSTPQPVPVSERLPGDELCWWYEPDEDDGYGGMWTLLRIRGNTTRYSHWLPANALTQPS